MWLYGCVVGSLCGWFIMLLVVYNYLGWLYVLVSYLGRYMWLVGFVNIWLVGGFI